MWIKICGITTAAAVEAALEAHVDAIGFVFARSVRELVPEVRRALARPGARPRALRGRYAPSDPGCGRSDRARVRSRPPAE